MRRLHLGEVGGVLGIVASVRILDQQADIPAHDIHRGGELGPHERIERPVDGIVAFDLPGLLGRRLRGWSGYGVASPIGT